VLSRLQLDGEVLERLGQKSASVSRPNEAPDFDMLSFMRVLCGRLDRLTRRLRQRVERRVALHKHPGVAGVMEAAEAVLRAVPGVEIVDLKQPAVGLQSVNLGVLPAFKRELQFNELH